MKKTIWSFFIVAILILTTACSQNKINIRLENTRGLVVGDKVLCKGLEVGQVSDIYISGIDLLAELKLDKDFLIPKGSELTLISVDVLGSKAISIELTDKNEYYSILDTLTCLDNSATRIDSLILAIRSKTEAVADSLVK